MSATRWVGRPERRREDARFLRGDATYLDDLVRPDLLHVAFVRSPYAHAHLGAIDASEARRAPGVAAVLAATDLGEIARSLPAGSLEDGVVADKGHPVLARERVRYVGEPVALVAASTRALAEDAAERVDVEYDPLEPVLDARTASERPLLHADVAANELVRWSRTRGDVDGAFAAANRIVAQSFAIPRLVAAPIEARGALAVFDAGSDLLTVWCSAQDPHRPLAQLGHALDRDRERLRIVVPDVGGAFGSKGAVGPEVAAVAAAAILLRTPLKWTEDRSENFLAAYQGRGLEADVELALAADGTFLALRAKLYADLGAYLYATTAVPPHTAAMLLTGAYRIPAVSVDLLGAATNKVPTGPYRGAGRPEAAFLVERMADVAAAELGLDPLAIRRKNFIGAHEFPYETPLGWVYDSGDFERCLDRVAELLPLEHWRSSRDEARADGRAVGVGVAIYVERSGGVWESAAVRVEADGAIVVRTGSSPHGQGHETTFAQIAGDELGVAPDRIEVRWGDSADVPPGIGTFASRSVAMSGSAVVTTARELRERVRPAAARILEIEPDEDEWRTGFFASAADGSRRIDLAGVAAAVGGLEASGRFESHLVFSSGAYGAAVEIDKSTGRLEILRLVAVDDSGRIVNPLLAEGQVIGATLQGIGQCLVEEVIYDDAGQLRTASFVDYALPTAMEVPPIETAFVETPSPLNPLGAKGIGEGGAIATPAAVANAVADALAPLGIRHVDPPFTEEKLWRLVREAEAATEEDAR